MRRTDGNTSIAVNAQALIYSCQRSVHFYRPGRTGLLTFFAADTADCAVLPRLIAWPGILAANGDIGGFRKELQEVFRTNFDAHTTGRARILVHGNNPAFH